jgi:hypothetical protein
MTNDWNDFEEDFRDEDDNDLSPDHREHLNEASGSDEDEWEEDEESDEEEEEEGDEEDRFSKMDDDDKWRRGYFYTGLKEDY